MPLTIEDSDDIFSRLASVDAGGRSMIVAASGLHNRGDGGDASGPELIRQQRKVFGA